MTTYDVAHIYEQGQNIIIILVDPSIGHRSAQQQSDIATSLQACARAAGLAGGVALVWDAGGGSMGFRARDRGTPFS